MMLDLQVQIQNFSREINCQLLANFKRREMATIQMETLEEVMKLRKDQI